MNSATRQLAALVAVAAVGTMALVGGLTWLLYTERQAEQDRAERSARELGHVIERLIMGTVELRDEALQALVEQLHVSHATRLDPDILHQLVAADPVARAAPYRSVLVVDAAGNVVVGPSDIPPGQSYANRPSFIKLRDHPELGLNIGAPLQLTANGVWALPLSRALVNADGQFLGIAGVAIPMKLFQELFEKAEPPEGSVLALNDTNGRLLARVPATPELLGTIQPLIPLSTKSIIRKSQVDGHERLFTNKVVEGLPLILVVGEPTERIFAEWRQRTFAAGSGFGVLIVLAWVLGIVSWRQTHLRLRDHRLHKLFTEQSFDLILWLDLDGVRHYVSPASTSILGREPASLSGGKDLEMVVPADRFHAFRAWKRVLRGQEITPFTIRLNTEPSPVWLEVSMRLTQIPGIEGLRVLLVGHDVTRRKEAEFLLIRAKDAAEGANRTKSAFLAAMSHELRTPLNAVIGFAELLEAEAFGPLGNERYRGYARDIKASGQHLLQLINQILDHAKAESQRLILDEAEIDLGALVDFALRMVRTRAEAAGITLTCELTDEVIGVYGDHRRLRQVLLNLLSNSVKFTPRDGSVTLSTRLTQAGELRILISDTGIGIPEEEQESVFEPFHQATKTTSYSEGTGLGLPLSLRLVELHGGRIVLTSQPGVGTDVSVILPADRVILAPTVDATGVQVPEKIRQVIPEPSSPE